MRSRSRQREGVRRTWQRIVRAHHLYVLAVARRSRVGNEYTIDRRVCAPEARQPNAHAHSTCNRHPRAARVHALHRRSGCEGLRVSDTVPLTLGT